MMRVLIRVFALCGAVLFSSPAAADTQQPSREQLEQEIPTCEGQLGGAHAVTADAKINACSDLLSSDLLTATGHARMLVNRSLGYAAKNSEDLEAADLEGAVKIDPKNAYAWSQNCSFHTWSKRDDARAAQECSKAIELAPGEASGWTYRGDIYLRSREFGKAISDYDHAIKIDAGWMWPWDNRGEAYLRSGKIDRATQDFEMVIKLAPDYAMGYVDRGIARIKLNQLDGALSDFETGLKVEPNCSSCLYGRGIVKGRRGDKVGAIADINAAKTMTAHASDNFDDDGVTPG